MANDALPFAPGDVLQTEPKAGFWGCAVVLAAYAATSESHPRFHVAVTPVIFRHAFSVSELDLTRLSVLEFSNRVRVAPLEYTQQRIRKCIGINTAKTRNNVKILGATDPRMAYEEALTLQVGDGTGGEFPLCGLLGRGVGWEAVVAWRRIYDADALERESVAAAERFEQLEAERLTRQRLTRHKRSSDA